MLNHVRFCVTFDISFYQMHASYPLEYQIANRLHRLHRIFGIGHRTLINASQLLHLSQILHIDIEFSHKIVDILRIDSRFHENMSNLCRFGRSYALFDQ
uniref:Uncharacterized protein n=1 Tax=Ascaris lumbricoides TaxID=6252 RepID=A0A0M3IK47_ASCLU